ncbi:MAG: hypothetical protein HN406_25630, partial [Lentisphaerae bacterium]|nr:hypothetical protein [Lentisphaerota bacterium]
MYRAHAVITGMALWVGLAGAAEKGPVAHYRFDGDGGVSARDASGAGHDARIVGAQLARDGDGRALLMEAEEAYADAGLAPAFQSPAGGNAVNLSVRAARRPQILL